MSSIDSAIDFWLGELDENGLASDTQAKRWWKKDPAFDDEIRRRYAAVYDRAVAGELSDWLESARGTLAQIIVLDQFARNMFRGKAKMYAADSLARQTVVHGIDKGFDSELRGHERVFMYMPLMHSEFVADHNRCIELLERFIRDSPEAAAGIKPTLDSARAHKSIVGRFGRFPHRNEILERTSTNEELEFLNTPGSSF